MSNYNQVFLSGWCWQGWVFWFYLHELGEEKAGGSCGAELHDVLSSVSVLCSAFHAVTQSTASLSALMLAPLLAQS